MRRIDSQSIRKSAKQEEFREQLNRFPIDQEIGSGAREAANRFLIDWETESILNRLDEQIWMVLSDGMISAADFFSPLI